MRGRGWHLVNGLQLRGDSDIDHLAFGPPGVFVVETKWSTEPWFGGANRGGFRRGVCVLWSAEQPSGRAGRWTTWYQRT